MMTAMNDINCPLDKAARKDAINDLQYQMREEQRMGKQKASKLYIDWTERCPCNECEDPLENCKFAYSGTYMGCENYRVWIDDEPGKEDPKK